jgi:hypothetical protein
MSRPASSRVVIVCALSAVLTGSASAWAQEASGQAAAETTAEAEATAEAESATASETETATETEARTSAAPTAPVDGPGGELDPNVRPGPVYGSRDAMRQSEPMALRRAGEPDPADPDLPVALSFTAAVGVVMDSSYDRTIQALDFGPSSPIVAMDGAITYALVPWLHVGGRLGARGRGFIRRDGELAMATGVDALAIAHGRFHLGTVVELGVILGGGLGVAGVSLRGTTLVGAAPRLHGAIQIGFRLARGFHVHLRGAWDFFPWNDLDAAGHDLDLGGPSVGVGIEVRS